MRTFCVQCGNHFDETKPGDDVCPRCRDRWEQEEREEQWREEDEIDFGGAVVDNLKELFQSWTK